MSALRAASARRRRYPSARIEKLAAALPRDDERGGGVKELLWIMRDDPYVQKDSLYSAIAWSTGLPHDEIGKIGLEVHNESRLRAEKMRRMK